MAFVGSEGCSFGVILVDMPKTGLGSHLSLCDGVEHSLSLDVVVPSFEKFTLGCLFCLCVIATSSPINPAGDKDGEVGTVES